jgi:DNA-binding transcriptional LysR family regulator
MSSLLPEFLRTHQRVELELLLSARTVNFVEEGFDLSIRIIRGKHAGRNGQILAPNRRIFCASPGYLKAHGAPSHPRELSSHSCLIATVMQKTDLWRYQDKGKIDEVRVSGPLISDNISILADSAVKGLGIVMIGSFAAERELKRGKLVEVLRGFAVQDSYFAMYVPNSTLTPQRVKTFMDYLHAKVGQPPFWDR